MGQIHHHICSLSAPYLNSVSPLKRLKHNILIIQKRLTGDDHVFNSCNRINVLKSSLLTMKLNQGSAFKKPFRNWTGK